MDGKGEKKHPEDMKKIKIGRLYIDPVFFILFMFFTISSFLLAFFVWLAS